MTEENTQREKLQKIISEYLYEYRYKKDYMNTWELADKILESDTNVTPTPVEGVEEIKNRILEHAYSGSMSDYAVEEMFRLIDQAYASGRQSVASDISELIRSGHGGGNWRRLLFELLGKLRGETV